MIEFKTKGHVIRLTRAEWDNIKKRFDPENAVTSTGTRKFIIKVPCLLCEKYKKGDGNCTLCPLLAFAPAGCSNGCLELLEKIFPKLRFVVNVIVVHWQADENYDARRQLNSIQRRMKEIEEAQ